MISCTFVNGTGSDQFTRNDNALVFHCCDVMSTCCHCSRCYMLLSLFEMLHVVIRCHMLFSDVSCCSRDSAFSANVLSN